MSDEPLRSWQDLCKKILGHCLVKNIGKALFVVFKLPNLLDSMLKLMSVLTRDSRYSEWLTEDSAAREGMNMCEVLDRVESRGMARGKAIGEARGKILGVQSTLISLVKKNLLSIRDAASEAGMSEEAFKKLAGFA